MSVTFSTGATSDSNPKDFELPDDVAARVNFNDAGLVPAIAQDRSSKRVVMMAWMDEHALAFTLASRQGCYYSRSRDEYWIKGLTSGHTQTVHAVEIDCDGDTVLLHIDQTGGACHTGLHSCFDSFTALTDDTDSVVSDGAAATEHGRNQ